MEIYDHSEQYVPDQTSCGFGEISIIIANEGIYVLQVDRASFEKFNTENLPLDGLEDLLTATLTPYLVNELKKGMVDVANGRSVNTSAGKITPIVRKKGTTDIPIDMDDPDLSYDQFSEVVKRVSRKVTEAYGFSMSFYSWTELKADGLTLKVCDYFLNKRVVD